jgi:hypothetical protein
MPHTYKYFVIATIVLATLAVVAYRNTFDRPGITFVRFVAGTGVAWALIVASRFVIVAVDLQLAQTPEQLQQIYDGDGAKNAFALMFGWVPGLLIASGSWLAARFWHWIRS